MLLFHEALKVGQTLQKVKVGLGEDSESVCSSRLRICLNYFSCIKYILCALLDELDRGSVGG